MGMGTRNGKPGAENRARTIQKKTAASVPIPTFA